MRPSKTAFSSLLAWAVFTVAAVFASSAAACAYTVKVNNSLDIGTVIAAVTGDTVFVLDAATGNVTLFSGGGRRVTATSVHSAVTISGKPSRGGDLTCDTDNVNIRINTSGTPTGRARTLTNFTVSMTTAVLLFGPNGTDPLTFQIGPVGTNQSKTFFIGATFAVAGDDSGLPSGNGVNGFTVNTVNNAGTVTAADSDQGKVKAFRSVAINKTSDLSFGMIGRPSTGNGTVTLNNGTGNRTVTGTGAIAYPSPAPTRGMFTISGEGGQQISLSVPTSLMMAAPGGATITATITKNLANTFTLSSSLGNAGTRALNIGGSFPMSATTTVGAYSAVLNVMVDYN